MGDIADMIRVGTTTAALNALKRTGGPVGFVIATQRVFRKRQVRAWIAALEAEQQASQTQAGAA